MANDQATYALVAYWRLENGMRALYDMRGDWTAETREAIDAAIAAIDALPTPDDAGYKAALKSACAVFEAVPADERRYVDNYATLAAGIELVGGREALDTDEAYIVSISVTRRPDKTRYYEGDAFDPTGMVVTALYSDGRQETVADYRLAVRSSLTLSDDRVYVLYKALKASVEIEVREKMPWDGEGTEEEPYLIRTADDLVDLWKYVSEKKLDTAGLCFRMTQDINMKNISDWRGIADNVAAGFRGHFDGAGYAVWNLNGSTYNVCGLVRQAGRRRADRKSDDCERQPRRLVQLWRRRHRRRGRGGRGRHHPQLPQLRLGYGQLRRRRYPRRGRQGRLAWSSSAAATTAKRDLPAVGRLHPRRGRPQPAEGQRRVCADHRLL